MTNRRWAVIGLGLLAALAGTVVLAPAPAYAHAQLVGTTPANGARLDTAPAEIVLIFSERVLPVRDGIRILDSTGKVLASGPARTDPDGRQVILPAPAGLGTGNYVVSWRVVSADSHPIHGAFAFGVGDTVVSPLPDGGAQVSTDPALSSAFWLVRWLGYAGLALFAGGGLFLFVCWRNGWAVRRTRRMLLVGWVVSVLSALAALAIQGPYANGGTLRSIGDTSLLPGTLRSDFGDYVVARLGLLVLAGILLVFLMRSHERPQWTTWAAGLAGLGLPVTWIGTGHANADPSLLARVCDVVHLAAMASWLGGLALLILTLRSTAVAEVASAAIRFSTVATICVILLVITGGFQAWRGVGSLGALAGSGYGRLLVFKLAAVGLLLWFGSMSRNVVRRRYLRPLTISGAAPIAEPSTDDPPIIDPAAKPDASVTPVAEPDRSVTPVAVPAMAGRSRRHPVSARVTGSAAKPELSARPEPSARHGRSGKPVAPVRPVKVTKSERRAEHAEQRRELEARKRLRLSVWVEVAIGTVVLAITSLLVATPPGARPASAQPQASQAAQKPPEVVATQLALTGGGRVYVQLDPARTGATTLLVTVLDSASKAWDVPEVTATLSLAAQGIGPVPVNLRRVRAGDYISTGLTMPMAGSWLLQLRIRSSEIDLLTVEAAVPVY